MLELTNKQDGSIYTENDVKTAYRKRANELHPDKGGSAEDFKELKLCFDVALSAAKHETAVQIRQDGLKSWKSNMRKKRKSSRQRDNDCPQYRKSHNICMVYLKPQRYLRMIIFDEIMELEMKIYQQSNYKQHRTSAAAATQPTSLPTQSTGHPKLSAPEMLWN